MNLLKHILNLLYSGRSIEGLTNENISKNQPIMQLTIPQIHELSSIIQQNQALVINEVYGIDSLIESDKIIFERYGVNLDQLYCESKNTIFTSLHFGLISDSLKDLEFFNKLTYKDLYEYISKGRYIPLTQKEIAVINHIRTQSLASLHSINNVIFQDVNQILPDTSRATQEAFLREEVERGYLDSKTIKQIASDIAHKTGDWSRDFDEIVQYISTPIEEKKTNITQTASKPRPKIRTIIDGKEVWI